MPFRIAFDLDDTLLSPNNEFEYEHFPPVWFIKLLGFEPLRKPTIQLFRDLRKQAYQGKTELWVYTSSFRRKSYIRGLFGCYGLWLDGVVNGNLHKRRMKNTAQRCSKYPPAFGIDILIDNSKGVKLEGEKQGFQVIQIDPLDEHWYLQIKKHLPQK